MLVCIIIYIFKYSNANIYIYLYIQISVGKNPPCGALLFFDPPTQFLHFKCFIFGVKFDQRRSARIPKPLKNIVSSLTQAIDSFRNLLYTERNIIIGGNMYVSSLEYLNKLLSGKYSKKVKDQYNEYKRTIT